MVRGMSTRRRVRLEAALDRATRISVLLTVLHMQAVAARVGINATDLQCLNLLSLDGPMPPSRLAETMTISKGGAITAMIDRLENAGYVRRTRDPHDRRRVLVEIVDGDPFRHLVEVFRPVGEAFVGMLADYTDEQIEFLTDYTTRSNNAFPGLRHNRLDASARPSQASPPTSAGPAQR
jgi:DNA-binding MarR family transcriptional regulator